MKPAKLKRSETAGTEADELFEMANLYPRTTGLPMTAWVSPRGNARHDVRIKVNTSHGNQMTVDNIGVVAIRASPHMIAGRLSQHDQQAIFDWINLNAAAVVAYWDGDIDAVQLAPMLKPLPSAF